MHSCKRFFALLLALLMTASLLAGCGSSESTATAPAADQQPAAEFTNLYGTAETICSHPDCSSVIAPSGDTNCCEEHSKNCLNCGKYIDEDAMYCLSCILDRYSEVAAASEEFTNRFGTADTICAHSGCSSVIASSGDTNCCEEHSRTCLNCGCYIDEDAMYCMRCLTGALTAPEAAAGFTNLYGNEDTLCAVSGCREKIASSGDTDCCPEHSNRCLNCGGYIDGDAMYCLSCIKNRYGTENITYVEIIMSRRQEAAERKSHEEVIAYLWTDVEDRFLVMNYDREADYYRAFLENTAKLPSPIVIMEDKLFPVFIQDLMGEEVAILYAGGKKDTVSISQLQTICAAEGREYRVQVLDSIGDEAKIRFYDGRTYYVAASRLHSTSQNSYSANNFSAEEMRALCVEQEINLLDDFCLVEPSVRILYNSKKDAEGNTRGYVDIYNYTDKGLNSLGTLPVNIAGRTYVRYYGQYNKYALCEYNGQAFWVDSLYMRSVYGSDLEVAAPPYTAETVLEACEAQHVKQPKDFTPTDPELVVPFDTEDGYLMADGFIFVNREAVVGRAARMYYTYVGRTPIYCYGISNNRALVSYYGELFWMNASLMDKVVNQSDIYQMLGDR